MKRLVVVGNGMAGMACVEQILKYAPQFAITVFGDETHVNYNRIMLSSVLAGEKAGDEITLHPLEWYRNNEIDLRLGVRITDVDGEAKTVTGDDGSVTPYDTLLLATGSSAWMPPIDGITRDGVFVFRTLDDTRELLRRSGQGTKAVVIGGGLLGLEAARGLQVQGCDVTVLHLMPTLMERNLDPDGGQYLLMKLEELGIKVMLGKTTTAVIGNGRVEGVALEDGSILDAEIVVVAAGIRPNVDLARQAKLHVNRGIVVNDHMETSRPDVFAVGECVEHRGVCYGLVAPLFEQGKVLAATITGNTGPTYTGTVQAAKLKIMGVDVFSAGDWSEQHSEPVRYEDRALGVYKKVTVRDNKLLGVILVGDTSDSHRYMEWLRSSTDLSNQRRHLLFPPPAADAGADIAEMHEGATVCGCVGVTKGDIITAIHDKGVNTLSQLKECTRASTGCGSCTRLCQDILRAVAPEFEDDRKKTICACLPFAEDRLREMLRSQKLKSVQQVLDIYGNGVGCEVCKPALSYMMDMLWCGTHEEDRSARFINDRVHANIQNDGTFSVIPAHSRRRHVGRRAAAHRRRRRQVPGAHGEDHRQPAHRSARHQEGRSPEGVGRPRHAVRPGVHQGCAHGEDVRRHRILPVRHAGRDQCRHRHGDPLRAAVHAAQSEDGCRRLSAELRRGDGQGHRPRRRGRRLAGGGGRRRRQGGPQSRSAVHRRDDGRGDGGVGALLPVLPRERQLSGTHLRLR